VVKVDIVGENDMQKERVINQIYTNMFTKLNITHKQLRQKYYPEKKLPTLKTDKINFYKSIIETGKRNLISIDESGFYLNMSKNLGRCEKGKKCYRTVHKYPFVKFNFICAIKYGKVIKVHDGSTITIATKLAYIDDTKEESNTYRFIIYLDSVCVSKNSLLTESDKTNIKVSKDELSKLIFGRIVELKDINTHNNGRLYATVFLDSININDWMLEHKYVIKCKNNKRRVSENNIILYESESEFETYNKQKDSLSIEIKQKILEEIISLDDIKKSIRKSFDFSK
jgi:hypothetical protein